MYTFHKQLQDKKELTIMTPVIVKQIINKH